MNSLLRRTAAVGLVASLALAGCGREDDAAAAPGVTDSTIKVGTTVPLSGPLSANGTAALGGVKAYFGAVNDAGGVKLADGTKRKLELVHYDDGYDPARAVQNYQKLVNQNQVFALLQTFGTPSNIALMSNATRDKVPQLFVHSGASVFSADQKKNAWTIGWQPTYESEGEAYAKHLVEQDKPVRVAALSQNDDLGKAFLNGFTAGIKGSQVKIVARQTYEPSDPTLDSQIRNLAASKADVLFSAVAIPKLQAGALEKAREIGWSPTVMLISLVSSIKQVITPSGATEGLLSTAFVKGADDPQWKSDPDVREYLARMKQHSPGADPTIPNAEWGYGSAATFVKALEGMQEVSRDGLMASVDRLSGDVPLLLPGVTLDGSATDAPPVHGFRIQEFRDGRWNLLEG